MLYLDTNIILRYLLMDHTDISAKAVSIIDNEDVYMKNEVLAEAVYVLNKTYKVEKDKLNLILHQFVQNQNINCESREVVYTALDLFATKNIDFVDALLCAYQKIQNLEIVSFDKKVNSIIQNS